MKTKSHSHRVAITLTLFCFALLAGLSRTASPLPVTSTLTVHVVGARNTKGRIGVVLFQGPEGFPSDPSKAIRQQTADIDPRSLDARVVFRDLPYGTYAVSVLHDENGNGEMDKNFMGIPKEGYGASNNPRKRMGPPGFDEAAFSVTQPEQTTEIKLIY